MSNTSQITLLLNDELVTADLPPGLVALDFLRKHRQLTGSKEGCKEGDCGACTAIVGTLEGEDVNYQPMTSCLLPMGELHGKHLVSIEGLNMSQLSPVQAAMVDCGGTQCGYCTPGFIVAMTAGLMDPGLPLDAKGCERAISGNLCRCTGYRSIKQAGADAIRTLSPMLAGKPRIEALCQANALPDSFRTVATKLKSIKNDSPSSPSFSPPFVAGGTDLYVQQGETLPEKPVQLLNRKPPLEPQFFDGALRLDARMSFEAFARHPLVQEAIPEILSYNDQIASWPIRTRATLAGNICNASPIADLTCLLLALEAELILQGPDGQRAVPLNRFYLGYKKLAKRAEEIVSHISFPKPDPDTKVHWEKVSKRRVLDIATVNAAIKIKVVSNEIRDVHLALGGVAPIPLYLAKTSKFLRGKRLELPVVLQALELAQSEFDPISDVRGSGDYKRLLARQLLLANLTRLFPETLNSDRIHAALR
ncbi:FAD binding domain-containing protein [Pelagicoccus sp. SDUM812003]|uniref:FAD binding domain-containing protein n=1 Tax=Pelagicoccus sp. SDUM812003 TaxID=3041267 RepID=UPI00280E296F|nr:FAD binding domain-containing protein [Pelagicoccus sp. SDUM812003]MDQ8205460.1 FAD binding domain-containing protein [Pelagicoccus sp. SDUM812003]